jgi:hypothetical protein
VDGLRDEQPLEVDLEIRVMRVRKERLLVHVETAIQLDLEATAGIE